MTARLCTVECTIQDGMFSKEKLATIQVVGPNNSQQEASLFADSTCIVQNGKSNPQIKATAVAKRGKDHFVIVLPQTTLANGPTVFVHKQKVHFA